LLLSPREIQPLNHRHRQNNNQEIGQDVERSVGEPHSELINASRRLLLGPKSAYRVASKDAAELSPDGVKDDEDHDGGAGDAEFGGGEDARVL